MTLLVYSVSFININKYLVFILSFSGSFIKEVLRHKNNYFALFKKISWIIILS